MANQGDQPTWSARALQIIQSNPAWGVDAFVSTGILDYDNVSDPTTGGNDVTFYQNSLAPIKNNTTVTTADWKPWGKTYSSIAGNPPESGSGAFQSRLATPRILNVPTGRAVLSAVEQYTQGGGAFRFREGFESGDFTAWDAVAGANITIASGAGHVNSGAFACDTVCNAAVATALKNFGAPANQYYGRLYFQPVTIPQAQTSFLYMSTVTGGNNCVLRLNSTNHLVQQINDIAGGTSTANATVYATALTLNAWYRVEWFADFSSPTTGALGVRLYNSAGTLLADTSASPTTQTGVHYVQTNMNGVKIGAVNSQSTSGEYRIDDVAINAASLSWVGA